MATALATNVVTVVDKPSFIMWYYPDKKIVHHQIRKFSFGQEFRDFLLAGTEQIRKNKATKWLSDDRSNTALAKEDLDWAKTNWTPQTLQAGWKHWAIVQPASVLGKMAMDRVVKDYRDAGLNARFFSDVDEAMKWLEAQ
ncbi:MAG TPA: hypothetical protein PLC98_08465 [Anaerolineales bacterium]|nr:hypothetical protein [Anaerolineales bacterium]